jgi:hypothetical protein
MSDQPKPATGYKHTTHFDERNTPVAKPATGKWTLEKLVFWSRQMICDEHNAALAAVRSKVAAAQVGNKAAKAFMDYLRANTGDSDEWPIELKVADDSIEPINTLLNQFEKAIYVTDTEALDAYVAQQLAAEREKVQTLVDALKGINLVVLESNRTQRRSREESLELLETMLEDALAKVKEGQ